MISEYAQATDWSSATAKRENDQNLYRLIRKQIGRRKTIRSLSFPSHHWQFEQGLIYAMRGRDRTFHFHGVELDPIVGIEANVTAAVLQKKYRHCIFVIPKYPCQLRNYIADFPIQYNLVYCDWMGTWGKEKREDVVSLFSNSMFMNNSIFICTVMLERGRTESTHELLQHARLANTRPEQYPSRNAFAKMEGIPGVITSIATTYGYTVSCIYRNMYKGSAYNSEISFAFIITK